MATDVSIGPSQPPRQALAAWLLPCAGLLLLFAALAILGRSGALQLGTGLVGDPPKHFTSGVMVFEYLRHGLGSNPIRFAESFEVQYPLVSIGHWPPMYYALQAAFYFLAGPSILSAQWLSAATAALLALLIFLAVRRQTGIWIALMAVASFLSVPLMQAAAWQIMSDLSTALFVFLAIAAFAKLLDDPGSRRAAASFALWAVAAVLTKGTAWALGPFFLLAPLLARRSRFFRSRWFVGVLVAVLLAGSVFYLAAARLGIGYPARFAHYLTVDSQHRLSMLANVLLFAPALLIAAALLGAAEAASTRWGNRTRDNASEATTLALTAAAWAGAQLLFLAVLPMTPEPRALLPSLAPLALLAARFLAWLRHGLRRWPVASAVAPAAVASAIVAVSAIWHGAGTAGAPDATGYNGIERFDGYREAASAMQYPPDGALILVATDDLFSEGALIAQRLSDGPAHKDVMLRGTHVLSRIDAQGNDRSTFKTPEEMRAYLLSMPFRYVVLSSPPFAFAYLKMVDRTVIGDPLDFHLIATIPIVKRPGKQVQTLRIYENPAGRARHPSLVQTPTGYDAGRRVLEYHWP